MTATRLTPLILAVALFMENMDSTVISTSLAEIARVLRPDGQLLFIEHVRAGSRLLAALQDSLAGPWRHFAGGCRCNRDTVGRMRACGFTVTSEDVVWHGMPAIVHPLAIGRATRDRVDHI